MIITHALPDSDELAQVIQLAKKETDALGFLTSTSFEHYAALRNIIVAQSLTGLVMGYVLFSRSMASRPRTSKIYQLMVSKSFRRHKIGTVLVATAIDICRQRARARTMVCCVAADLEANHFWTAQGFIHSGATVGGSKRNRSINHYTQDLFFTVQNVQ